MRFWVQEWFVLNVLQTLNLSTGYWLKWDFESRSGLYSMYYRPSISPQDIDRNEILSPRVVCTQCTTDSQSLHRILIEMRFWVQEWFVLNVLQTLNLSTGYWLKWDFESRSSLYSMYYRPSISPQDIDRNEILSPRVVCTQCTTDSQSLHRILIKMRFWVQEWFVLNVLQTLYLSTGYW